MSCSQLFSIFRDLIYTSQLFQNNLFAYFTIKQYTFSFMNQNLSSNPSYISSLEFEEYDKLVKIFNSEISSATNSGKTNLFFDKISYERFVEEVFKGINFDVCDRTTLVVTNCLITVLSLYGEIPVNFARHQNYIRMRIAQFDGMINNSQPQQSTIITQNITPNPNVGNQSQLIQPQQQGIPGVSSKLNDFLNNKSSFQPKNESVLPISNLNTSTMSNSNTKPNFAKKASKVISRSENPFMLSDDVLCGRYTNGLVSFNTLINNQIPLPVTKGSIEYKFLREVIKEHLMFAEQEALYNKLDNSKAHMDVAIYYLKSIQS